jgi:hypothetical protein
MLHLYTGTDREKVRVAVQKQVAPLEKNGQRVVRVTDAHVLDDLSVALQGSGMFGGVRVVILENTLTNDEMAPVVFAALPALVESVELHVIVEEKVDAATRKRLEKHAEKSERFDAAKEYESREAFALANALQRRDKKGLWVGLMREYAKGSAPEMLHGILFWAAKQQLLRSPNDARASMLVTELAELPHEARRCGFDLDYALEHFALSKT